MESCPVMTYVQFTLQHVLSLRILFTTLVVTFKSLSRPQLELCRVPLTNSVSERHNRAAHAKYNFLSVITVY